MTGLKANIFREKYKAMLQFSVCYNVDCGYFVKQLTCNWADCTVHKILDIGVFCLSQGVANQTGMFHCIAATNYELKLKHSWESKASLKSHKCLQFVSSVSKLI